MDLMLLEQFLRRLACEQQKAWLLDWFLSLAVGPFPVWIGVIPFGQWLA